MSTPRPPAVAGPARDEVWPRVDTAFDLERSRAEWLHTNGAGAYAMSTVPIMHTRRHHGLLVATRGSALESYVVLSHAETLLEVGDRQYRLSTHQFPGVAPTPGYRLLRSFAQDPLPRWSYQIGKHEFQRVLALVPGHNILVLSYLWHGHDAAKLLVRPLMPMRRADALVREHGGMLQKVVVRVGEVCVQPVQELPSISFLHGGVFMGSPDWWRRFEYEEDRRAGLAFEEDMWTPGLFELALEPGQPAYLVVSLGEPPSEPPEQLLERARHNLLLCDPGAAFSPLVRRAMVASSAFCLDLHEPPVVKAGYPGLGIYVRDTLLALPGFYLARGRISEGQAVLREVLRHQRDGLLTEHWLDGAAPSPDATLWLFEVASVWVEQVGREDPFVLQEILPALVRAFERITHPDSTLIWLTADGLVANGDGTRALTWMDSHVSGAWVTPRRGLAVEWQALWVKATTLLIQLAQVTGKPELARDADSLRARATARFGARFWCSETDYPYDCVSEVSGTPAAWADRSVRPNAVIALAVEPNLFEIWQRELILSRAQQELLSSQGLRTLSSEDPRFVGQFGHTEGEMQSAFHQGGAWPHLLGHFVRASLALKRDAHGVSRELVRLLHGVTEQSLVLGQIAQVAEGDPPHRLRGCPAYAVAVAELLRCLLLDLPRVESLLGSWQG